MGRTATALVAPAVLAVLLAAGVRAGAEVWRWSDERGTHFIDSLARVPPAHREEAREMTGTLASRGSVVVPGLNAHRGGGAAQPAPSDATSERDAQPDPEALARRLLGDGAPALLGLGLGMIVGLMVLVLPVGLAIHALFLMGACRVASDERPPFGRALAVCGARFLASIATGIAGALGSCALGGPAVLETPGANALSLLVTLGVNASLLASMLGLSIGRAAWVLVVEWLLMVATVLVPALAAVALVGDVG